MYKFRLRHQYRGRAVCTSVLTMLCTVGSPTSCYHLNIPKNDNRYFQKWQVYYSTFKEIQEVKD